MKQKCYMDKEIYEKLVPFEKELRWAVKQSFMSLNNGRFGELMLIYNQLYGETLSKAQLSCGTCRLRAMKRIGQDFLDEQQRIALEQKEERLAEEEKESTPEKKDEKKSKRGRPRWIDTLQKPYKKSDKE